MQNETTIKIPVIRVKHSADKDKSNSRQAKEENKFRFPDRKFKNFKDSYVYKDPNFIPFKLTNPRATRSKSPPVIQQSKSPSPKTNITESKPKFLNRDFLNYKTTTDFFSRLYIENKKLLQTFSGNFQENNDVHKGNVIKEQIPLIHPAWNLKRPGSEDSQKEIELYSEKILKKIKKISLISSFLGENCYEIVDLLENEKKTDFLIKEYIKEMKFNEFLEIQQGNMRKLMKIFREVIVEKVLLKEGEGLMEVGVFLVEKLDRVLENFKEYFNKYQELFSNMRLLQENELKIENGFYEGLYYLIDSYNIYYHENQLFGKAKPTLEAYVYSIQQFKRELNKDSRNQKASKLYEDLELTLKGLLGRIAELKDDLANKETENKKLSDLYEEKIKKNKDDHISGLQEKRKESAIAMYENTEKAPIKQEILIMNQTLEDVYKKQLIDNEKDRKELLESLTKSNAKCKKYKEQILKMTLDLSTMRVKKTKDTQEKIIECNFYKENFIEKTSNLLKNLLVNPSENIVSAFKQSREWTSALITLLLNEKGIADFQDEAERRPRETLQNFIIDWFLRRFGNRNLAEIFLKDFLLSLRTLATKSERFRIFSELSNIDWNNGTSDVIQVISNMNKFNKNVVKTRFMSLNETLKVYMKIIFSLQNFSELKYKEKSVFYPFMPNILIKGQDLLPVETAKTILENILQEESMGEEKIREALIQLKSLIVSGDEAYSLDEEGNTETYHQNPADKEQYIRFDYFSRFLLDFIVEHKLIEIENIYMALKLKNTMKSEGLITFDDFSTAMAHIYPKKSLRWMESSYHALVDGIKSEATPLNLSLRGFLPLIYHENSACENFYPKNKNFFVSSVYNTYINYVTLSFHENYEIDVEEASAQGISPLLQKKKLARVETNSSINALNSPKKRTLGVPSLKSGLRSQKVSDVPKNIVNAGSSGFNEQLAGIFDSVSSLSLLEETYKIIKHIIIQSERNNTNLMALHEEFKSEMTKIPSNISKLRTYEIFNNYDKKDLMYLAESNWKRFRNLLYVCFNF